jgi:hypothetical protein
MLSVIYTECHKYAVMPIVSTLSVVAPIAYQSGAPNGTPFIGYSQTLDQGGDAYK